MKKLFVSSTFKDMQLERDALKAHIIPSLNARLREYGTKISQTDLRWGISTAELTAEEGEQKVLNVCLEEINKSRPYMIVMIGERYGWIPSPALIEMNARGKGIPIESPDISVTQLEIEYIAFTEKWDESRIFFYFRDFDYGDMDAENRAIYESESDKAREKLSALKARIKKKFPNQIRRYTLRYEQGQIRGVDAFEALVTEDLYSLFRRDMEEDEKININVRVKDKLHSEALESLSIFEPAYDMNLRKGSNLVHPSGVTEKRHCYIGGAPRCGKTLSVQARYAAFYAYTHQNEPCFAVAEPLFKPAPSPYEVGGPFSSLPEQFDMEKTFPLYLQIGNCKDIRDDVDLLRTTLYYLNRHLELDATLPTEKDALIDALCQSLAMLTQSDRYFYLFVDDLTPEALKDLFAIEHAFTAEQVSSLMEHFFFYISFSDQFSQVPVYLPFYEYSESRGPREELYFPADYFFAYARKMGKELSPGVRDYILSYYAAGDYRVEDADLTHITIPHANLMANYFMNLTTEDYAQIKSLGNDMQAIEARQLALLSHVRGNFHDDMNGNSLRKVTLLNLEKFQKNHTEDTLKALGIIYVLSGSCFSMEEAEQIYAHWGKTWSDLAFISYFDDFKEFFLYNKDEDSYRILPEFEASLRTHFLEHHLKDAADMEEAVRSLIRAAKSISFDERKRPDLFHAVLLVPSTAFVEECFSALRAQHADDYLTAIAMGQSAASLLKNISVEQAREMGQTISPLLFARFSSDTVNGFFDGIGHGFQNHAYERNILAFADGLSQSLTEESSAAAATALLSLALLKAYCYLGYKNDKAISLLFEAEEHLPLADDAKRVRYLSVLSSLLRRLEPGSPLFLRISKIIKTNLPPVSDSWENTDRALSMRADLFTLAYFVKRYAWAEDFFDPDLLLAPFLTPDTFERLGLQNIDTAIYALDAKRIGMDELLSRSKMFMECLSVAFPSHAYASRLISTAMLARMFNVPAAFPEEEQSAAFERYFYPYQKAVLFSNDGSGYHYVTYGLFLQNARFFHYKTGITHEYDEILWQATEMGNWPTLFFYSVEESIDVILAVCYAYVAFLRDPSFHDMLTSHATEDASRYMEEDAEEPSIRALLYRLTVYLASVLHNPESRIMKPRLKRLFHTIEEHYGDYMSSLASMQYRVVKKYIDSL